MRFHKFLLIIFILVLTFWSAGQSSRIDSLKAVISSVGEDSVKVNALLELSAKYYRSAPGEAIQLATEARDMAEILNYQKGVAYALKAIGMGYYFTSQYIEVLLYWQQSLQTFQSIGDTIGIANMLSNLGAVYFNQGDDAKAIENYLEALRFAEEVGDTLRMATAMVNIGAVYKNKEATYDLALEYYYRALPLSEQLGDQEAIGTSAVNISEIYEERGQIDSALFYGKKALEAYKKSVNGNVPYALNNLGKIYAKKKAYAQAVSYQKEAYEFAHERNDKLEMANSMLGLGDTYIDRGDLPTAIASYKEAARIAGEIEADYKSLDAYKGLAEAYEKSGNFKNAYEALALFSTYKDSTYDAEMDKKIQVMQLDFDIKNKQAEIDLLAKDKALQEVIIQKQKFAKNAFMAGLILIFIIAFIIYRNYRNKARINKILDRQKAEIESLLLNILPSKIAEELQRFGTATPRYYENVSILFTDFKGFSRIAEGLSPNELVTELNDFFKAFDDIIEKFNLEKIKTIGDAYMCAGGIPTINNTHALDAVNAGLAMQEYMKKRNTRKANRGMQPWELRVGIHTGPIVAGVVGKKKYAYDIWGSSVNISSRMESNGEAGKINISAATYKLVKDHFDCQYRGKIYAKNIGDIDMYFVEKEREPVVPAKD